MRKTLVIAAYFLVFWIFLPAGLIVISRILDHRLFPGVVLPGSLGPAGIIVFCTGLLLMVISVIQFRIYSGSWPVSAFPPEKIIRKGLYAAWAHPIYLFAAFVAGGMALSMKSPGFLFLLVPVFILVLTIYIILEERALIKRFGKGYLNYRKIARVIFPIPFFWLRSLLTLPLFKILFRFRVYNRHKIPDPPFFVVAAHRCYLDPFFISAAVGIPVKYLSTFEMFRSKTKRKLFAFLGAIPKRRYRKDIRSLFLMDKALKEGYPVGIFPEGERSWTGKLLPFKTETLRMFRKYSPIPVLPVRMEGNYYTWPRWSPGLLRSKVSICFEDPVHVADFPDNSLLEKEISSHIRPREEFEARYNCTKRNITGEISRLLYRCPVCFSFDSLKEYLPQTILCRNCGQNFTIDRKFMISYDAGNKKWHRTIDDLYTSVEIKESDIEGLMQTNPHPDGNTVQVKNLFSLAEGTLCMEENDMMNVVGTGQFDLTGEEIRYVSVEKSISIPVKDILSIMIESYYKLQIFTSSGVLYQITLEKESVLKWRDMLVVLMRKKGLREPMTR